MLAQVPKSKRLLNTSMQISLILPRSPERHSLNEAFLLSMAGSHSWQAGVGAESFKILEGGGGGGRVSLSHTLLYRLDIWTINSKAPFKIAQK